MQSQEFNKLMTGDAKDVEWAELEKLFSGTPLTPNVIMHPDNRMPVQKVREEIKKHSEPIPDKILSEINQFIKEHRTIGTKSRTIRRMVKKLWNITVV